MHGRRTYTSDRNQVFFGPGQDAIAVSLIPQSHLPQRQQYTCKWVMMHVHEAKEKGTADRQSLGTRSLNLRDEIDGYEDND